jgi:hypothetical protein
MLPIVSSLAPPTGHLLTSSRFALSCSQTKRTLLPMSNTESIAVARREYEDEDTAAYTKNMKGINLVNRDCTRKTRLALESTKAKVGEKAGPYGNFDLCAECLNRTVLRKKENSQATAQHFLQPLHPRCGHPWV